MDNVEAPLLRQPVPVVRWGLVGLVLLLLLAISVYDGAVFALLGTVWQKILSALGLDASAAALQQGLHRRVTRRPLLPVATYAVLYVSLCLLLLRLLLQFRAQWRLTLRLYAAATAVYLVVAVAGKLAGDAIWAYRLSRHLIDFVVGPIPVAGLLILFRSGFGPTDDKPATLP